MREEEKKRKRFPISWVDNQSASLPGAPFSLSPEEITLADQRAKNVLVPAEFDWRPREIFRKTTGMKSHEWKQVVTNGVLTFCLRKLLRHSQRHSLFQLFDVITRLCAEDVDSTCISDLECDVHRTLALMERNFPVSLQVIVFHLLHHLPVFLRRFGPVYSFWMYPYERFNGWIARRIHNKRFPESTVIVTYRLSEWASFMQLSGQLPEKSTSTMDQWLPDQQPEDDDSLTSVNASDLQLNKGSTPIELTTEQVQQLECYYLSAIAEYRKLTEQYARERQQAKVHHQLRRFPDMSHWVPSVGHPLTQLQSQMCRGVSNKAAKVNILKVTDVHNRTVTMCSVDVEYDHSYTRRSYVSTYKDGRVRVGSIITLFHHTFLSTTTTFAYVSFFDGPFKDCDSTLSYVLTNTQTQYVIPVTSLSKPLVSALDEEEPSKLWILNFHGIIN